MRKLSIILPVVFILIAALLSSIYVVKETEKALVLQFGRVVHVRTEPGLSFKVPIIQDVVYYNDRILSRDMEPIRITPLDQRILIVDAFARFRIDDVVKFRSATGSMGLRSAEASLDRILDDRIRSVLGSVSSNDILSVDRDELMDRIRIGADAEAQGLGLSIVDVRLKRTDLPMENLNVTFARMIAEREREAEDLRARGREQALRMTSAADREVVETESAAGREGLIARGKADAEQTRILAEAYGADPEFFQFYRSMKALEEAATRSGPTMVLDPNDPFFAYLKDPSGAVAP